MLYLVFITPLSSQEGSRTGSPMKESECSQAARSDQEPTNAHCVQRSRLKSQRKEVVLIEVPWPPRGRDIAAA